MKSITSFVVNSQSNTSTVTRTGLKSTPNQIMTMTTSSTMNEVDQVKSRVSKVSVVDLVPRRDESHVNTRLTSTLELDASCFIDRLPTELLHFVITLAVGHPDDLAIDNQQVLICLQLVCKRWCMIASPLLETNVACQTQEQVEFLLGRFLKSPHDGVGDTIPPHRKPTFCHREADRITSLSLMMDVDSVSVTTQNQQVARSSIVQVANLIEQCRNLSILEVSVPAAYHLQDWSVLEGPLKQCSKLEEFTLTCLDVPLEPTYQSEHDKLPPIVNIMPTFQHLTHLRLTDLLNEVWMKADLFSLEPFPQFKLQVFHIGSWFDLGSNWSFVDWLLHHSQSSLREIACQQFYFTLPTPPPPPLQQPVGIRRIKANHMDPSIKGFTRMMNKYGTSLTRLNFGLFITHSCDAVDYEDFAPFIAACPNLMSYTHGDIAIDLEAIRCLASSGLRQLRVYYVPVMMWARAFARLLKEKSTTSTTTTTTWKWFRQLKVFHVVMDDSGEEATLPSDMLEEVEAACAARGIEMMRTLPRRFKGLGDG